MQSCLVSIVTIAKNNIEGLSRTLESVRTQDYQEIEHLVIDGNSSDGTKELLKNYIHSKQYRYYSEADNGISSAFNKGIERSTGQLIFFLNSGDVFCSDIVISQVVSSYLEVGWQCAQGGVISSDYAGNPVSYMPPKLSPQFLKYFMFLPHQGFFCEMRLHKQYRFDEAIKTSMDYDLFLNMLKNVKIFYLPFAVAKCEPGGISSESRLRVIEQSNIRLKHAVTTFDQLTIRLLNLAIFLKDALKINSPFAKKY